MSMLSLKLPLCELNTEKAEIEVGGREGGREEGGREGGRVGGGKEEGGGEGGSGRGREAGRVREGYYSVVFTLRTSIYRWSYSKRHVITTMEKCSN